MFEFIEQSQYLGILRAIVDLNMQMISCYCSLMYPIQEPIAYQHY